MHFLLSLYHPQDFLGGLFGKTVVLHKATHFGGVNPCVFRKSLADAVTDVIFIILGAGEAELPEQGPVGAVLVRIWKMMALRRTQMLGSRIQEAILA